MKKIIVIIITTISVIFGSCGGQKNTPSTSSTADSTNMSVDSAKIDTTRNQ